MLGLIFLKYISDTFEKHHAKLVAGKGEYEGASPEDKDECLAANVFSVPTLAILRDTLLPNLPSGKLHVSEDVLSSLTE